jgi:3-deoxy-manno-octulosonate cytidylyltransferase (CMP-KDO synthetase)
LNRRPEETVTVIPARLSSTRLREKPLVDLKGKPLIRRVWENAVSVRNSGEVIVATDSQKIKEVVEGFGGKCVMTPDSLTSGSDRVYYAAAQYFPRADIVVNLQGDEPFIDRNLVEEMINLARRESYGLYSAYFPVDKKTAQDSSVVKVVINKKSEALYFSRSLVPFGANIYKKHLGIYVWRRRALEEFYNSAAALLEKAERLEQLRVLESGAAIKMQESPVDSVGIDTEDDLRKAVKYLDELK